MSKFNEPGDFNSVMNYAMPILAEAMIGMLSRHADRYRVNVNGKSYLSATAWMADLMRDAVGQDMLHGDDSVLLEALATVVAAALTEKASRDGHELSIHPLIKNKKKKHDDQADD